MARRGIILVVAGPSGAGKSTLVRRLVAEDARACFSVSMTTRPPREGEVNGVDYFFVDDAEFERAVESAELIEHARVHTRWYGTPQAQVDERCERGDDVVLDIDVQGAQQVRERDLGAVFVFVSPPSYDVLEQRLRSRGTEDPEQLRVRLATARAELEQRGLFDYEVINDDVDAAYEQLRGILLAERCRIRPGALAEIG